MAHSRVGNIFLLIGTIYFSNLLMASKAYSKEKGPLLRNKKEFYFRRSWKTSVIPYEISSSFEHEESKKIRKAMDEIEKASCIVFKRKEGDKENFYLFIRKNHGDGCKTNTEAQQKLLNGVREMSLDPSWCLEHGRILHELMHSLGFNHEHQRPDRDKYIEIMWDNIKDGEAIQFSKSTYPMELTYGFTYDLTSIMHYANWSHHAAIDINKPIILPKEPNPNMGQRKGLDKTDIVKLNFAYKCNEI